MNTGSASSLDDTIEGLWQRAPNAVQRWRPLLTRAFWGFVSLLGMRIPPQRIDIEGFLHPEDRDILGRYARTVPRSGVIVEVGTYKGLSSTILATSNKKARVFTVDPLDGRGDSASWGYVEADLAGDVIQNHRAYGVRNCRIVRRTSREAVRNFSKPIDLLFIDGSHEYEDVHFDFFAWGEKVRPGGTAILHDATERSSKPGCQRVGREAIANPNWSEIERDGLCLVLRKEMPGTG